MTNKFVAKTNNEMIARRNVLLTNHYREFVTKTYSCNEFNVYVESIDAYLFHVVIDMHHANRDFKYRNVDSFVIRFRSYSHDEFDELSKIYA